MIGAGPAAAQALLPVPVVVPIIGAILSPLVARVHRSLPLMVSVATLLTTTGLLLAVVPQVYGGHGRVVVEYLGHHGPANGSVLGATLAADPFGLTYALLTAAVGALLLLAALSELGRLGEKEIGGFACLFQLLLASLIGFALTADTINMFVWFQVAALASYGLTGFFLERPIALEAAFKIVVLTSIAGFAVFVGASMLYVDHSALNIGQLHLALERAVSDGGLLAPDRIAAALLLMGFATKAGVAPMHGWLPDAHTAAPGAVSAAFSGLMVNLGVVGVARLALQIFPIDGSVMLAVLTVVGAVSAIGGAALALGQDDLKRVLAWDTVSQMGVLLIGFGTSEVSGVAGAAYHLVSHGVFKALLFLCAGAVVHTTGETELSEMGGLLRHRPGIAIGFVFGTLSIAGVPPLAGYYSLGMVHEGAEKTGGLVMTVVMIGAQVLTVAALGRAGWLAFFARRSEPYESLERPRAGSLISIGTLGAGCVALGVVAGPFVRRVAGPAAGALLHPHAMATAIMGGAPALPPVEVPFEPFALKDVVTTAATIVAGALLAWWYVRRPEPRAMRWLRASQTGSTNDYAAFAVVGFIATAIALLS